jgi:hypothetical protein
LGGGEKVGARVDCILRCPVWIWHLLLG